MPTKRRLMNEEQLKTWVLRKLGSPRVNVELHKCHIEDAFEDACDWYIAEKGIIREARLEINPGQVSYETPEDAEVVLDVILPALPFDFSLGYSPHVLADETIPYDVFSVPESAGIYSSLVQVLQYTETSKRILSAEFNWIWNEATRRIIVSPIPHTGGTAIVQYKSNSLTVEQLNTFDFVLFKSYMLALAKEVLGGRILGKYGTFPTAQGERDVPGADRMIDEAIEAKEVLTEKLRNSCFPMPFITG